MLRRLLFPPSSPPVLLLAACGDSEDTIDTSATTTTVDGGSDVARPCRRGPLDDITVSGADGEQPTRRSSSTCRSRSAPRSARSSSRARATRSPMATTSSSTSCSSTAATASEYGTSYRRATQRRSSSTTSCSAGVRQGLLGLQGRQPGRSWPSPRTTATARKGGDAANGLKKDDTLVFVADVKEIRHPLPGRGRRRSNPSPACPPSTLDDDGAPTITVPDGDPPAELVVQPLIEGDGRGGRPPARRSRSTTPACCGAPARCSTPPGTTGHAHQLPDRHRRRHRRVGQGPGRPDHRLADPARRARRPRATGRPAPATQASARTDTLVFVVDILDAH